MVMKRNNEKMDEVDALLHQVQPVEAPEFLLTRIHAQLDASLEEQISVKWAWVGSCCFALLLLLNIWTIQHANSSVLSADAVIEEMNLMPSNSFYNQ